MENLIGPVGLPGPGHAQIYWQGNDFAALESDAHIWFTNLWAQALDKQGIKHESPSYRPWGQGIVPLDHAGAKQVLTVVILRTLFVHALVIPKTFDLSLLLR